jgi:hypothetical protein
MKKSWRWADWRGKKLKLIPVEAAAAGKVFFIFLAALYPRTGASRLKQRCILNISVRQHILSAMINIFSTPIKPWEFEILVNSPVRGDSEHFRGSLFYLHIFKVKKREWFKIQYGIIPVNDQLDAQFFFLICSFQSYTCFEQQRAHHQENQLYQYNIWYTSLCKWPTCIPDGYTE